MKMVFVFLVFVYIPCSAVSKGEWDIGGKAAVVKTNDEYGIKTGIKCEYRFLTVLTWRTDIEALIHGVNDLSRLDVSVPSNLLWYPIHSMYAIDPYVGPGLTFTHTWDNNNWLGINLLAGMNFSFIKNKIFGIEMKYSIPLIPHISQGNFEVGLTGAWEVEF